MPPRAGLDYATIVHVAAELADAHGVHELSMATLAARLNVRTPTLYHYVAGLPGLRRALALLGIAEVSARLGRAVMGKARDEAVLALAHTLRDFAHDRPGLYEAAQRAPDADDDEWQEAGREVVAIMMRTFAAYNLSEEDARHAVRMLRSIVHGCVALEQMGGFGIPRVVDETFRRLLVALLQYLDHGASERPGGGALGWYD